MLINAWIKQPVRIEQMSEIFTKYHLGEGPWPFKPVFHHFTAPDFSPPHDHPWNFSTFILKGSYVEKVYTRREDGSWATELVHRKEGTSHYFEATHIHQLVELPEGECWTLVLAGPAFREWKTYDIDA